MPSASDSQSIIVAGHICLDIIVTFDPAVSASGVPRPGETALVGPANVSTGGAVANTGLALHRLGTPVRFATRIGDDRFGQATRDIVASHGEALASGIRTVAGETSSYSVVLSPLGADRSFIHCPGANDRFDPRADVPDELLAGAAILHFGYPPNMRSIYGDGGAGLAELFDRARRMGLKTSLDMTQPDPKGEGGKVDWIAWMRRVLPHVDFFLPSLDETAMMLGVPLDRAADPAPLAERLLDMGCPVVGLKLGERGFYLQTRSAKRFGADWSNRQLWSPCFKANVVGTTGSGDCTIAGFLAAYVAGESVENVLNLATATGACSVETADANSGVPTLAAVRARRERGWQRLPVTPPAGWAWDDAEGLHRGPRDDSPA